MSRFPAYEQVKSELDSIFNQAGPDFDLSNVDIKGVSDNRDKLKHVQALNARLDELKAVGAAADRAQADPDARESGTEQGNAPAKDAASRTLDALHKSKRLSDGGAERAESLLKSGGARDRGISAEWLTVTGDPAYESAFAKLVADPLKGHMLWDSKEQHAYQRVEQFKAMSLTDAGGGHMVPTHLDPAIMLSSDGSINPLRQMARVVQTPTESWNGVSSDGVVAEWLAEAAQASDASPTVDGPSIPVHKGSAWVPYSFEVGMDAAAFSTSLSSLLMDAADQLQATAFTTGSGTGQPTGLITALAGGSSEVTGGGSEALDSGDPFLLQNQLPARFSPRAQWGAHIATMNTFRQMETTNGAHEFPELRETPPRLLGKSMNEISNMDGTIDDTASEDNYPLVYGDFRAGFVIADRIGTTVELVQNVMGANQRPTGQRGLFMWFRTGSDVVVDNAFRLLSVPTTA